MPGLDWLVLPLKAQIEHLTALIQHLFNRMDELQNQFQSQTSGSRAGGGGGTSSGVTGSGTTNRVAKWTGASALGNSLLSDDGTNVTLTSGQMLVPDGTASLPGFAFSAAPAQGFFRIAGVIRGTDGITTASPATARDTSVAGTNMSGDGMWTTGTYQISPGAGLGADIILERFGSGDLALRNGDNPQDLRVYGATTGTKYLRLAHNGTDATVDTSVTAGKLILGGNASDIQWGKALVALGGGAPATLGTVGGSGPTTATQNTWMQVKDSTGATFWVPAWR